MAVLVVLLGAAGLWWSRSGQSPAQQASRPEASTPPPAQALQTGAAYVATTKAVGDAVPGCAPAAATCKIGANGAVVTSIAVAGPKQVSVVVFDKAHPERPNTSHAAVSVKAGTASATVTVPAPPGGIDRVQVGIQGDQGTQRCIAKRAS
jgi:hypothetical protein